MELKINLEFNQLLKLIHQLPKKDIERLSVVLQSEISANKSTSSLQKLILDAPTWTDSELQYYNEARTHFNQSRIAWFCWILLYWLSCFANRTRLKPYFTSYQRHLTSCAFLLLLIMKLALGTGNPIQNIGIRCAKAYRLFHSTKLVRTVLFQFNWNYWKLIRWLIWLIFWLVQLRLPILSQLRPWTLNISTGSKDWKSWNSNQILKYQKKPPPFSGKRLLYFTGAANFIRRK